MSQPAAVDDHDDIIYPATLPFVLVHLVCLGAIWTGVNARVVTLAVALYVVRMFGVTAGYHRYFSHRTFRTSRMGQFLLALLAQSSAQRGCASWTGTSTSRPRCSRWRSGSPRGGRGSWWASSGAPSRCTMGRS